MDCERDRLASRVRFIRPSILSQLCRRRSQQRLETMVAIRCLSKALDHSRRKPSEASLGSAFRKRSIWSVPHCLSNALRQQRTAEPIEPTIPLFLVNRSVHMFFGSFFSGREMEVPAMRRAHCVCRNPTARIPDTRHAFLDSLGESRYLSS